MLIATNMVIIGFDPSPGLVEFTDLLFQCPISNWITGVPIVSSFARWCHGTMAAVQVGDEDIPGSFQCDIWCLFHHPNITTNGSIYFHIFHSKNKRSKKIETHRRVDHWSIPARYLSMTSHNRPCPDRCCSAQRSCDKTPGTGQDRWGHMAVEGRELQRKHEKTLGSDEYLLPEDTCEDRPCWRSKVG